MKLAVLVLEDEPPVRTALARDLSEFAGTLRIEIAESVDDAWEVIGEITGDGDVLALILSDHRMPGATGVDFLVSSVSDPRTGAARRVLVTGQAGHQDTIRALNDGRLHHYIAKPWDADELKRVVRDQLTTFVLDNRIDPLIALPALDATRAMTALRHRPGGEST